MRSSEGTAAGETQTLIGRTRERAALLALVEREPIVAVVGAAGVGKSALVRATLIGATVISLADCRDEADCVARLARAADSAHLICDDLPH